MFRLFWIVSPRSGQRGFRLQTEAPNISIRPFTRLSSTHPRLLDAVVYRANTYQLLGRRVSVILDRGVWWQLSEIEELDLKESI